MRRCFLVILSILLLLPLSLHAAHGFWAVKRQSPIQRSEVAAVALKGKIYVIGGFKVYNPLKDEWKEAAPLPAPLHHARRLW